MSQHELTAEERGALHEAMAAWAKVMPYNHLGPEYGLSDGIWTRLDRAVERILAARGESLAGKVRALHVRRDAKVYSDAECAEGDCDHEGPCFLEADAVCAHCADQTEPGGAWEHMVRPDAYWPCATIRLLDAAIPHELCQACREGVPAEIAPCTCLDAAETTGETP